jgi:hypothetical protein
MQKNKQSAIGKRINEMLVRSMILIVIALQVTAVALIMAAHARTTRARFLYRRLKRRDLTAASRRFGDVMAPRVDAQIIFPVLNFDEVDNSRSVAFSMLIGAANSSVSAAAYSDMEIAYKYEGEEDDDEVRAHRVCLSPFRGWSHELGCHPLLPSDPSSQKQSGFIVGWKLLKTVVNNQSTIWVNGRDTSQVAYDCLSNVDKTFENCMLLKRHNPPTVGHVPGCVAQRFWPRGGSMVVRIDGPSDCTMRLRMHADIGAGQSIPEIDNLRCSALRFYPDNTQLDAECVDGATQTAVATMLF